MQYSEKGKSMFRISRRVAFAALAITAAAGFTASAEAQSTLTPPKVITASPTGINMVDGTFTTSATDLSIGALTLERSYLGGPETSSKLFGLNWTHNYDIWITWRNASMTHEATTTVIIGREKYVYYGLPASAVPQSDEEDTSLQVVSGNYVFTNRNGVVYTINGTSRDVNIRHPNGLNVDVVRLNGLPKLVTASDGSALVFDYSGTSVSAACAFNLSQNYVSTSTTCATAALKTTYQYTSGNLTGATDVRGNTAHYDYGTYGSQKMTCLTDPGTTTCKINNYYATGRNNVEHQVLADGSNWYFYCSCSGTGGRSDGDVDFPDDNSSWTDPAGNSVSFDYHGYVLVSFTDQRGLQYLPTYFGRYLTSVTSPEGNKAVIGTRDERFPNYIFYPKPNSGLTTITQGAQTFPARPCTSSATCYLPLTISDAKGNVTDFAYDQTHGGVLSTMGPAPTVGSARPLKLNSYVQKYAYILSSGGSLTQASSPIWLPATETQCQTTAGSSAATCDPAAPIRTTTYEYGADGTANNLFLRAKVESADGVSLRTCYGYDWKGKRIWETSPRAGLSVCQ
jgi:hypothetical protein